MVAVTPTRMGLLSRDTRAFSKEDERDDNGEIQEIRFETEKVGNQEQLFDGSKATPTPFVGYSRYTMRDHARFLHLSHRESEWPFCDMTHLLLMDDESESSKVAPNIFKDYISPVPFDRLKTLYLGLQRPFLGTENEPLPVRTLTIRTHPHVKCGSVMDAIHKALISNFDNDNHIILKRQGAHFRLVARYSSSTPFFLIDAQLCTSKMTTATGHEGLERRLVLRVYHAIDDAQAMDEITDLLSMSSTHTDEDSNSGNNDDSTQPAFQINLHLKEASSLLQYLLFHHGDIQKADSESPGYNASSTTFYLLGHYHETDSVRNVKTATAGGAAKIIALPALSQEDWSVLQASFPILKSICEQLQANQCIYRTTDVNIIDPIEREQPPPMMDVQFGSQLRQISRVPMLQEVAMVEDDLEAQLRNEEAAYRNFLDLLEGTFDINDDSVPKPSYVPRSPSDLVSPTRSTVPACSSTTSIACMDTELVGESVHACDAILARRLFDVFVKQDHDELRNYINQKNVETINRLVQIESEQRKIGSQLEKRTGGRSSKKALEFALMALEAQNVKGRAAEDTLLSPGAPQEVPLLEFPSTGGRCYVTLSRILFYKRNLIKGPQISLFDLTGEAAVDFVAIASASKGASKSTSIEIVCDGESVYCFRPTRLETMRVKGFLDTLRTIGNDDDDGMVVVDV